MKSIISVFMIICFAQFGLAQEDFYAKQWVEVQQLENKGLTKSALEKVDSIAQRALSDNNAAQRIKALLYQSKYALILEEDAQLKIISSFKAEIEKSDIVTKRVIENLLATLYWQYFQQNRYRFYNRTNTAVKVDEDFRTWDLHTIYNEIHTYYQRSLQNGLLLQQESLEAYKDIIVSPNKSASLRPTLYDLLSHNALSFYKVYEDLIRPSYAFEIDKLSYLSIGDTFMNLNLQSQDSLSLKFNTIKIYQNLLRFHHSDSITESYVDVDIERLNFIYQHHNDDEKTSVLTSTLTTQSEKLGTSVLSGLYKFELAKLYQQLGNTYNNIPENNEQYRWHIQKAVDICNDVISQFPNSRATKQCRTLIQQIKVPFLKITAESHIPTNTYSKLLVTYKNLDALSFKIYSINETQLIAYSDLYNANDQKRFLNNLLATKQWNSTLPNEGDFQQHSTEIVVSQLPNSMYIVHAQTKEDDVFATAVMQATNLALVESNEDKKDSFQIIDRTNGQPKVGAIVEMKYKKNSQERVFTKSFTTDRYGKIYFNKDRSTYRNIYFKIKHNDEEGYFGQYYINRDYNNKPNNDVNYKSFVFTDRSIYRPGQVVYYKGIITQSINDKTSVAPGMQINVALHNVNGEKLSSLQLETNEFGSIKGEFILPNDGLTGQYYIRLQSKDLGYDNTFFSVEEYKRPKFEANFKPVSQLFRVNDTVTVNGEAMAYAGSAITDAKVVYKVIRSVNYPSWYYWRRPFYTATTQEIVHGVTQTNSKGEFFIDFKAIPDSNADRNDLPIFNYEITADITDINGETLTAVSTVQVGYHAMTANIIIDGTINKAEKFKAIAIDTRNLNGEFVGASGNLKIYKLIPPKKPLRPRPWLAPDYQQISEDSFNSMFPNEPYNNEEQLQNWKLGKMVYETTFNTSTSKIITLEKIKKWVSGKYVIELQSEDKFGQPVKAKTYTTVYDPDDKRIADNQLFTIETNKNSYQPNDKATVTFASAAKITITVD
ncbi:MAG: alpha-2-macroglobulin, partial [Winogradskyella sp.]|nr:alpha-2-macroglobulin [Winogradskyella sp.]